MEPPAPAGVFVAGSRQRDGCAHDGWVGEGAIAKPFQDRRMRPVRQLLTRLGTLAAHPAAFVVVSVYALCWYAFEPQGLDWHGVATLATWCMTLLIQRAEHRDTQAIHAKLDELLHAQKGARDAVARIDEQEPEEIERLRAKERKGA
jgi:low affinity Fe/Cu permease